MKITKVTDRTIMLTVSESAESTVNLALVQGSKHNFIIDTGVGSNSTKPLLEFIKNDSKPLIIINTHADWDHFYGNCAFENNIIVSHKLCRERMDKEWEKSVEFVAEKDCITDGEVRKCLPNMTFESTLHFPDDGISLFHTPFHTIDDISVYDAVDKILHIGDTFGFEDGIAYPWGNELDAYKQIVETYKRHDFNICLSGHSEPHGREIIAMMEAAQKPWQEWLKEQG
ncbi:MAG: MBL fold metallo-hydrolase [Defluviitaleaceae bacterium]|nr:MBL fold metallo-hydrolase [Defluviitaleaceae bacterium]